MRIFILEDEIETNRKPILKALAQHEVVYAKDVDEAKAKFVGNFDVLLLDHDMNGYYGPSDIPNCGAAFVRWLVGLPIEAKPRVIVHSQNERGRDIMLNLLSKAGFKASQFRYGAEFVKHLEHLR